MLNNKVGIVTGSARGIGRAVALKFAEYGAKVVCADYNSAEDTVAKIKDAGGSAIYVRTDVTKRDDCAAAVDAGVNEFGTLDILANCAGINIASLLLDITDEVWDAVNNVNVKGTLYMCQYAGKVMKKNSYGRIVNISSQAGKIGEATNGAYCISKAAIIMLTQILALELAESGIAVNAVCPGATNGVLMEDAFKQRGPLEGITPEEYKEKFLAPIPLHRMAEPYEIGEFMAFLASDRASYITGCSHTIAGGNVLV